MEVFAAYETNIKNIFFVFFVFCFFTAKLG